jgi:hypothetical protein
VGNYRVLTFDAATGWNLDGVYRHRADADALAALIRAEPRVAAVALIRGPIDNPRVVVLSANVPRPESLVGAPNFRRVATAL